MACSWETVVTRLKTYYMYAGELNAIFALRLSIFFLENRQLLKPVIDGRRYKIVLLKDPNNHQPSQVEQIDGFNTPSFETCNWT